MTISRRDVLRSLTAASALSVLPAATLAGGPAPKSLRLLILGGTGFIGPHEINYAIERGHEVTMFNRGKTAPDMFPNVERLIGDRNGQLDALKGREWDAVIDNSGFFPRHARLSAELLKGSVGTYLFVSSISAYDSDALKVEHDEFSAPYAPMDRPLDENEHTYGPTYGARKALCEQEVARVFGDNAINVRPGIITGPGDPTDRLRHWLIRMVAGNDILVPGGKDWPVQYIDARDMSNWMIRLLEQGEATGPYNAVGGIDPYAAGALLPSLRDAVGSTAELTWVDWEFILERHAQPPTYSPWFPGEPSPFMQVNNDRALATGLEFRPIEETAKDMVELLNGRGIQRGGFDYATESKLLEEWAAK
ncbi:MAG: NAD-dependent epimerase/dehydratase family protein [Woeseiaceae bacterium]|nr:NAD-dependent epimerase/dehydratase family protein [Woeseiaceae bacterium]